MRQKRLIISKKAQTNTVLLFYNQRRRYKVILSISFSSQFHPPTRDKAFKTAKQICSWTLIFIVELVTHSHEHHSTLDRLQYPLRKPFCTPALISVLSINLISFAIRTVVNNLLKFKTINIIARYSSAYCFFSQ